MQSAHLGFPIRFPMNFHDVVKFLPDRVQLGTNEISDFWAKCLVIDIHFDFLGLKIELSQKIGKYAPTHVLRLLEFTVPPKFGGRFFFAIFQIEISQWQRKSYSICTICCPKYNYISKSRPYYFRLVCSLVITLKKCGRSKFSSHQSTTVHWQAGRNLYGLGLSF